jgi:hypothetical protein
MNPPRLRPPSVMSGISSNARTTLNRHRRKTEGCQVVGRPFLCCKEVLEAVPEDWVLGELVLRGPFDALLDFVRNLGKGEVKDDAVQSRV